MKKLIPITVLCLFTFQCEQGWLKDILIPVIEGCTNSSSCNYNSEAEDDDGSCIAKQGCNEWCEGDSLDIQETDCYGECGGSAIINECGECAGGNTGLDVNYFITCTGECHPDSQVGCNQVEDENCGGAYVDACGNCVGGNTGVTTGDADFDGICDSDETNPTDCAGSVNGDATEDNCGTCDSNNTNDCVQDCAGVWGGDAPDTDGDGICDNIDDDIDPCSQYCCTEMVCVVVDGCQWVGVDDITGTCVSGDCSDPNTCSNCTGCESSCCPNYCSGNYYYYNRSCSNEFCVGATSDYCSNGCDSYGCIGSGVRLLVGVHDVTVGSVHLVWSFNSTATVLAHILIRNGTDIGAIAADASIDNIDGAFVNGAVWQFYESPPTGYEEYTYQIKIIDNDNNSFYSNELIVNMDCSTDECGICDYDNSNDCVKDCYGIFGGTAIYDCNNDCCGGITDVECKELDNCGVCDGDNSPSTGNCDCAGVPGGSVVEDCAGECGGTAFYDACGRCVEGNTGLELGWYDNCGVCDSDSSNDCVQDCAGVWGGTNVDADSDGICDNLQGTVSDIDGNTYKTIIIGTQTWMAENLKVTKYKDGTAIPTGHSNSDWANLITGAYAVYDNNSSNADTYGNLYNWYAVENQQLCMDGWHVPTDAEWTILTDYLGGEDVAGGKMKEAGTEHWNSPNIGATNESGFTAFPAGYRSYGNGAYDVMGYFGYFWSSSESSGCGDGNAWSRKLHYSSSNVSSNYCEGQRHGLSVRCLKD